MGKTYPIVAIALCMCLLVLVPVVASSAEAERGVFQTFPTYIAVDDDAVHIFDCDSVERDRDWLIAEFGHVI